MSAFRLASLTMIALLLAALPAVAEPPTREQDTAAIRAAAEAYMDALRRGDGTALAGLWTSDGDIVDDIGRVLKGRETVGLTTPREPGPKPDARSPDVRIKETKLRFLTADVAIEDGQVEVVMPDGGNPLAGRFSATWVREAGAWKIAALREARDLDPAGPELLRELDWMVGEWKAIDQTLPSAEAAKPMAEMTMRVRWNESHTYLLREIRIQPPGGQAAGLEISQRIGWDPLSRRIRSWSFGSDGSHSEATWTRDGGSWVARNASVQPDGSQTSAINIYTFDGKDRCAMRSLPTHVGGEHMPPVVLTLVRTSGSPEK